MPGPQRIPVMPASGVRALFFLLGNVIGRLRAVQVDRMAGNLTFTTVLGLVPLFTVALAYVSRLPGFESWMDALEPLLFRFLLPGSSGTVRQYLSEFTARTADLQGIAIAFVIYTAVSLVAEIEREINLVWGITTTRSFARRAIVYAIGFIAVPALIGAAVFVTQWLFRHLATAPFASETVSELERPLALAIGMVVLALIYRIVPARRVPWRAALVAGMLAAVAFDLAKAGFAFYISLAPTYRIVYGALAALPLFLIWVYLSWLIVLAGAAIAAALAEMLEAEHH
jgi:membrane protein